MQQIPPDKESKPSSCAGRWVDLAERILVCGRVLREELRRQLEPWLLTEPEFSVLWACMASGPVTGQNELVKALVVSPAQISATVERLRRKRLLSGRRAENDRRRQLWRLTPAGRAAVQSVLTGLAEWAHRLDLAVGEEHAEAMDGMMVALLRQLEAGAMPAAPPAEQVVVLPESTPRRRGAA